MSIRLIAVDLDGTLLDDEERVSAANRDAVAEARRRGVPVVPVTGRPDRIVWGPAADAGLGPLGVCANGAVLVDLDAGAVVERTGFSGPEAVLLVDALRAAIPGILLGADRGDRFLHEADLFGGLGLPARPGRTPVTDLRDEVAAGCLKLVARRADLSSVDLAALVTPVVRPGAGGDAAGAGMDHLGRDDLAEVTASDIAWVDIGPAGCTKATGLATLCARLGIGLTEVAAIGDHYNDLPMLRAVGLPGAMGNAIDEVKRAAVHLVGTNVESGVAAFIDLVLRA